MAKLIRKGFTLVELIVTSTLAAILVLTITCIMAATVNFNKILKNRVEAVREARVVTHSMTYVLRFAKATPAITFPGIVSTEERLTATIEKGHIPTITSDAVCYYRRDKATNYLYFKAGAGAEQKLSGYVTSFDVGIVPGELTLKLIFTVSEETVPVESKVKLLGN